MSDEIKINLPQEKEEKVKKEEEEVVLEQEENELKPTEDFILGDTEGSRRPCNWHIVEVKQGISAVNLITGEKFVGTMEAFNELWRS